MSKHNAAAHSKLSGYKISLEQVLKDADSDAVPRRFLWFLVNRRQDLVQDYLDHFGLHPSLDYDNSAWNNMIDPRNDEELCRLFLSLSDDVAYTMRLTAWCLKQGLIHE
jgi:hypothetical protein